MKEKLWIWGMGGVGRLAFHYLRHKNTNLKGLIDNDGKLWHMNFGGYEVINFEEAKTQIHEDETVLCCCSLALYEVFKKHLLGIGHAKFKHFYDLNLDDFMYRLTDEGEETGIVSRLCTESDFASEDFQKISEELAIDSVNILHRKTWEWVYIIQALRHYKVLGEGKRGIGFAVGREPLPSYFAKSHTDVLASDLAMEEDKAAGWMNTNQHASGNLKLLWNEKICTEELFMRHVKYRDIDMNALPPDEKGYDFCWSSCAIEHVGSLEKSKLFLKNMLNVLKSGGVAIHTTEFNLSSDDETVEYGDSVIFRKKDIEELKEWFLENGHYMETSYKRKRTEGNSYIDISPYKSEYKPYHLSLEANGYAETSFAIIVVKDGGKMVK